jgi:hypothetical protein
MITIIEIRKTDIDKYINESLRRKCYNDWVQVRRCAVKHMGDSFAMKLNMSRQIDDEYDEEQMIANYKIYYENKKFVHRREKYQGPPPEDAEPEEGEEAAEEAEEEAAEEEAGEEANEEKSEEAAGDQASEENSEDAAGNQETVDINIVGETPEDELRILDDSAITADDKREAIANDESNDE